MRNKYPWTNCLRTRHTAVGPIRFNSTASLPLRLSFPPSSTVLSFFFFHPVSISDLHDPLTPWRTIDPRLTLLGVVSLSARPLSSPLSPLPPFPPLLLCSLMRGRDHLEYNFASFRIIIDFVSRSSFLFFSFFFLPNIFQFLLPPSLLLSNNHRLIDYYTRYTDGKYVAKYPRIGREAKWSIIQFKQARLFVQWLVQVAGTRIGHSLINPFGNRIRRRLRLYPAVCVPPSCPPCLVHPGQLITVVWIHLVHRPLLTTVADHRVCLSAFRPNYGNTPLYDAMITTANRLVPRFN